MRLLFVVLAWVYLLVPTTASAKKVALLIGNAKYTQMGLLDNPPSDVRKIGARLKELGFELVGGRPHIDLNSQQMTQLIDRLEVEGRGAEAVVFYFSGHGSEIRGINYLYPVSGNRISADYAMDKLEKTRAPIKMLLLDACRSDPNAPAERQAGFTTMTTPVGVGFLIGYATQPRTNASDGPPGTNSPYAEALLQALQSKGLDLWPFLQQVAFGTMSRTKNEQRPWITASPIGRAFYFNPTQAVAQLPPPPPVGTPVAGGPQEPSPGDAYASDGAALAYIQRAYDHLSKAQYANALRELREARKVDPHSAIAESYTGFTYLRWALSRPSHAERLDAYKIGFTHLDRAIKLDPVYSYVRRHHGNTIVATYISLQATNRPVNQIMRAAVQSLTDASRLDPTSIRGPAAVGMAHLVGGNYDEAIRWFDRAIATNRFYAVAYSGKCMAYRLKGNGTEAQRFATEAARYDRDLSKWPCLREQLSDFWTRSSTEF